MPDIAETGGDPAGVERVVRSTRLPRGQDLVIREATDTDVEELGDLFERLSPEDRHRRFFSTFHPGRDFLERMVSAPDRGGLQLVAEIRSADPSVAPRLVGEAGYSLRADGDATLAITVDRTARGWSAPYLLDALADSAAARGIANLRAEIQLGNRPMLALARARGCATVDSEDLSFVETTMSTGDGPPSWPPRGGRPRVLVEVPGARWRATPELRHDDIDVIACGGPGAWGAQRCPMLHGGSCPLVAGADVVVFALRRSDPDARELLDRHRRHGTRPLVIDVRTGDRAVEAPADAIILEAPSPAELRAAVEASGRAAGWWSAPGDVASASEQHSK